MRVFLAVIFLSLPALALECPAKWGSEDFLGQVEKAIKAQKSCEEGSAVAESCALGASGDNFTAVVAERKCGLDFWPQLTAQEKQIYNGLQAKCDKKYKGQQGTMYISFNAFCRLSVARLYSQFYTPVE